MARTDARKKAASSSAAEAAVGAGSTAPGSAADAPPMAFEDALAKLEEVVDRLEGGELDLEVALSSFEEGVRLTRQCAEQLDTAERRIEVLMKEGDQWMARPFESVSEADEEADGGSEADSDVDDADQESWED